MLSLETKTTVSSDIELTDTEKDEILADALRKKKELLKYDQDMERRRQWEEEARRTWGPKELALYIEWKAAQRDIPLTLDADNHPVFKALCRYFTGHESFEKMGDGYSLKKGIMLCGNVGRGKTTLMSLFRANKRQSFRLISCRDLADRFATEGHELLHNWSRPINVPSHIDTFYQNEIGVCFDDLGTESSKKNFGNEVNVMENILMNRYDLGVMPFYYTHVTTNLSGDQIEEFYGTRVRSRMREMFNMIILPGEDRRK